MGNNIRKPIVGITQGDGNGIGYEVIIKALADSRILESFIPIVYGSSKMFGYYKKSVHELQGMETNVVSAASEAKPKVVNILNCLPDSYSAEPGQSTPEAAKGALLALGRAVEDIRNGDIDILVTAPINKKAMAAEGFAYTGHTEYLKHEFGAEDIAMFMVSERLKVGVVTEHIPLKDVPKAVTMDKILGKIRIMDKSLKRDFGVDSPKIAVLSLNPHSGDGGLLGDEEQTVIIPAIAQAVKEGIQAFGPYSPDGFFGLDHYRRFDATLAMYHDQGLAPFKSIAFDDGVNFTAGLPIVRTSPDHGTAYELAGKDEADPHSMMSAIFKGIDIWRNRMAYDELQEGKMPEQKISDERPNAHRRPQIA